MNILKTNLRQEVLFWQFMKKTENVGASRSNRKNFCISFLRLQLKFLMISMKDWVN